MVGYKKILGVLLLTTITGVTVAQNNTNSPYTRYGYGQLADQSFGNSKAMGGIAFGLRNGSQINATNPASYTAIDSLTFLFDGGLTLQNTNFSDGKIKMNSKNSSFDYIAMQFRLSRKLAMSAGFLPFSNVGYNFGTTSDVKDPNSTTPVATQRSDSYGDGGLHQVYAGAGYAIAKNFSVGANISYLFGTINRSLNVGFGDNSGIIPYNQVDELSIRNYKLDLGAQYTFNLDKKRSLTLGVVFSPGHDLKADAKRISRDTQIDTLNYKSGFDLPTSFGAGVTYVYDNRLTVGLDYSLQKWSKANFFGEKVLCDRSKISIGAEFVPNPLKRSYLGRIKYRVGAYYSDPYVKVADGTDDAGNSIFNKGAREYGISGGFGLPVFKSKSILSISGQFTKVEARTPNMISEKYLKLSIGLTFNEAWFMKWKVE